MAQGGKRPGAGRPLGSKTTPRFEDYVTEEERKTYVEFVMSSYMGDMGIAKWVGDHLFKKPAQEVSGVDGGPIQIAGVEVSVRKA